MNEVLGFRRPSYLRVVATTRCNYSCEYCHMEGDTHQAGVPAELPSDDLIRCLRVAARAGIRKLKFLGGEPLLRKDLDAMVACFREQSPSADISVITAGVVPVEILRRLWVAGLDRANISIHGFTEAKLARRICVKQAYAMRQAIIEEVLSSSRPAKFNYVYTSPEDLLDLGLLLQWAAEHKLLVNVLDDLQQGMSWKTVAEAVVALRGQPLRIEESHDPNSLDTLRWIYSDGLEVELKHQQLGVVAPYQSCSSCVARRSCREGIYALRLTHEGSLRPCMDRLDLGLPLAKLIRDFGDEQALSAWNRFTAEV